MFTRKLSFIKPTYPKARAMGITEFPYFEHDSNGKLIYWEDEDGYWYKREYNSSGNMTYYEDSFEYWVRREYDSNGKEVYYEDSTGEIRNIKILDELFG